MKVVREMFTLPWQQEILHQQCTRLIVGSVEYKPLKISSESGPCSGGDPLWSPLMVCCPSPLFTFTATVHCKPAGPSFCPAPPLFSSHCCWCCPDTIAVSERCNQQVLLLLFVSFPFARLCTKEWFNKTDTNDTEISAVLGFITIGEFLLDAFLGCNQINE